MKQVLLKESVVNQVLLSQKLKEANSSNVDKRDLVFYFLQVSNMSLLSIGQLSKARATAMHQYQGMLWCAETRMRGATGSSTHV